MAGVTNGPQPLCHQYLLQVSFITIPHSFSAHTVLSNKTTFIHSNPRVPRETLLGTSLVLNLLPFPSFIPCYQNSIMSLLTTHSRTTITFPDH